MSNLTADEVRAKLLVMLHGIAPEIDLAHIDPAVELREQTDLDSMDFLNLMVQVEEELGVTVPETDYARLDTLDAMVDYLARRLAADSAGEVPEP